jgi:NADPH-dependent glutamate synthase beta subunit-like oxidoreductase
MLSDCTYGCTLYTVQSAITYGTVQLYYTAQNSSYYSVQLYSTAVR